MGPAYQMGNASAFPSPGLKCSVMQKPPNSPAENPILNGTCDLRLWLILPNGMFNHISRGPHAWKILYTPTQIG
jgi:hypothetical protein